VADVRLDVLDAGVLLRAMVSFVASRFGFETLDQLQGFVTANSYALGHE